MRSFSARSTAPRPMMGRMLAVQLITASNSCRRLGRSARRITSPPKRVASFSPRSSVRLAITIDWGFLAAKWVAASSIISPAPTKSTRTLVRSSNNWPARRTAAAAMLMECAPISVDVRTSLATAKERWKSWFSVLPRAPACSATRTASFICPRICGSPSTIESSPLATRKACRATGPSCNAEEWERSRLGDTPPVWANQSTVWSRACRSPAQ